MTSRPVALAPDTAVGVKTFSLTADLELKDAPEPTSNVVTIWNEDVARVQRTVQVRQIQAAARVDFDYCLLGRCRAQDDAPPEAEPESNSGQHGSSSVPS